MEDTCRKCRLKTAKYCDECSEQPDSNVDDDLREARDQRDAALESALDARCPPHIASLLRHLADQAGKNQWWNASAVAIKLQVECTKRFDMCLKGKAADAMAPGAVTRLEWAPLKPDGREHYSVNPDGSLGEP